MHLGARLPRGWNPREDRIPRQASSTQNSGNDNSNNNEPSTRIFIIVASVLSVVIILCVWVICAKRSGRKTKTSDQKPGFFGRIASRLRGQGTYSPASAGEGTTGDGHQLNSTSGRQGRNNANNNTAVGRNTSVRSVMTLPAYRQSANTNEQVLGREGERDGVDTIIDLPNEEQEEELRNQEMETMYQMRVTRRQQIAEREERRERRRDARAQNDYRTLQELRDQTRAANEDTTIRDLRGAADQIKENRQRSVSSVSYADLGVARHDGTRIRANSSESERVGLLSDAASMQSTGHQRGRSASSALSYDGDGLSLTPTRSRGLSASGSPEGRAGSSPEIVDGDLGNTAMPPPEYEDISLADDPRPTMTSPPPDYSGPHRTTSQRTTMTERDLGSGGQSPAVEERETSNGLGGNQIPQLPSLRISRLPEIVIEPSSAHPRDEERQDLR